MFLLVFWCSFRLYCVQQLQLKLQQHSIVKGVLVVDFVFLFVVRNWRSLRKQVELSLTTFGCWRVPLPILKSVSIISHCKWHPKRYQSMLL